MLLIYTHKASQRILYIFNLVFKEMMGVDYQVSIDSEGFKEYDGPRLNYSDRKFTAEEFYIQNHSLLFEHGIKNQAIDCFTVNNNKAFFKTTASDFPFDIFAAAFYLVSRYEEYLPHEKDSYGRYDCERSLAYREKFLHLPLVNLWIADLAESLKKKFLPGSLRTVANFTAPTFRFIPTYDIDIAYSYKHKGLLRNAGGYFKTPTTERLQVLAGAIKDPFDCYDWLNQLHRDHKLRPIYFFLVAQRNGQYDKNILPHKDAMWKLVKKHAHYTLGIHPSWQSGDDKALLKKEIQQLEAMSNKRIYNSRQHYIRFNLPEGYQRLLAAGIMDDYSMGYGTINGFRASIANSFFWYDLEKDTSCVLRIHPFCFMDANAWYEQRQNTAQTLEELMHYLAICRQVNGELISIWHNNFLGSSKDFAGWRDLYQQFIAQVQL